MSNKYMDTHASTTIVSEKPRNTETVVVLAYFNNHQGQHAGNYTRFLVLLD